MKAIIVSTILAITSATVLSAEFSLPPKESLAQWSDFELGIQNLTFSSYGGHNVVFDGGSTAFSFTGGNKQNYALPLATKAYWNEAEKTSQTQVYFFLYQEKFYRLAKGSDEESRIIEQIQALPQKPILTKLVENLKSRKAVK